MVTYWALSKAKIKTLQQSFNWFQTRKISAWTQIFNWVWTELGFENADFRFSFTYTAISFIFQKFFHHFEKFYIAVCLLRYSIIGPTTLLATISEKMVNTEGIRIPTWDLKMRARFWKISNLDFRVCSCRSAIKID